VNLGNVGTLSSGKMLAGKVLLMVTQMILTLPMNLPMILALFMHFLVHIILTEQRLMIKIVI
jgi:hypothetical protein